MNERKKKRIIQRNKRIKKREALDVDITSLLDILVILLVFLLQSYNASNLALHLAENTTPPESKARDLGENRILIQVNADHEIWVNDEKLPVKITTRNQTFSPLAEKLNDALAVIGVDRNIASTDEGDEIDLEQKEVNLVFDRDLPYEIISVVMETANSVGLSQFKFIVMAKY